MLPLLLLAIGLGATGCGSTPGTPGATPTTQQRAMSPGERAACARWVHSKGGIHRCKASETRLAALCDDLLTGTGSDADHLRVRLLNSDAVRAYAMPPNRIYVSRGAMQTLPADELAAAVAHELGHLIDDGYLSVPTPYAVTGRQNHQGHLQKDNLNIEVRADAVGAVLLEQAGYDRDAMQRLVTRLAGDDQLPYTLRGDLRHRAGQLAQAER